MPSRIVPCPVLEGTIPLRRDSHGLPANLDPRARPASNLAIHNLLALLLALRVLGPVVLGNIEHHELVRGAEQAVQPEQVEGLQGGEQHERDDVGQDALILSRLPVHPVGSDGAVLEEERVEDAQVEVVAEVGPHADAEGEVWADEAAVDVVERLGGLRRGSVSAVLDGRGDGRRGAERLTARKKSLIACVRYTAIPM